MSIYAKPTLIEITVVVAIILILGSIAFPAYRDYQKKISGDHEISATDYQKLNHSISESLTARNFVKPLFQDQKITYPELKAINEFIASQKYAVLEKEAQKKELQDRLGLQF